MSVNETDMLKSETARVAEAKPVRSDSGGPAVAAIILAGGLSVSPLENATACSVLDLNVAPSRTVLDSWERALTLGAISCVGIAGGGVVPAPTKCGTRSQMIADESSYRGPGGAAFDAWERLGKLGRVVIVEGTRWGGRSLEQVLVSHASANADVTVAVNPDGSPAGIYVAEAGAMGLVPRVGYVDIKEQWLARARSSGLVVRGCELTGGGTHRVRTLPQLLEAARTASGCESPGVWRVICPGARVMRASDVVDSIVMPGGVVERGAVVARSLVLPGGRVESGEVLVDGVARADGRRVVFGDQPSAAQVTTFHAPGALTDMNAGGMCDPAYAMQAGIAA